ncbi:MAG: helix-turn-helix domain-containing protein [Nostocoides sp.]
MGTRTNATVGATPSSTGVLRPGAFARTFTFAETEADEGAAYWVQSIWSVTWAFPGGERQVSSVVPNPSISVTVERGGGRRAGRDGDGVWITGVATRRFDVLTEGVGGVVGIKFRPGGFTALTGVDAGDLTDRVLTATELLPSSRMLADLPLDAGNASGALCDWVRARGRGPDDRYDDVTRVLACLRDPEVTRVSALSQRCGLSVRTLQRLLRSYVGVGPKWLLARQRLHDAMIALDDGYAGSMADLAARLGWSDQTHFTRDFVAIVGTPPAAYRDRLQSDR